MTDDDKSGALVAVGSTFPECYNAALEAGKFFVVAVGSTFPECYNRSQQKVLIK